MHYLLLATHNSHKTREFAEILGDDFEVRDLSDQEAEILVEEIGATFQENATLKAVEASRHFSGVVVADDSGLEVDALSGAPGIYSARYAGPNATDAENVAKLLAELEKYRSDVPSAARFRCCLALARQGKLLQIVEGVVEGTIVTSPRGTRGFGYDPIFQPDGFGQTFGELLPCEKNKISHRAQAIHALRQYLLEQGL